MAEYVKGKKEDRDAILDLANLVFSQANVPHDFRKLLPKVYGDRSADWMADCHYLVKEGDAVKALVACPVITMEYVGQPFEIGLVGTVSVHPYRRGSGYMKGFMKMMEEDMKEKGVDILALGGRHHRYQYFGFDEAGSLLRFHMDSDSIQKAWGHAEDPSISFRAMEEGTSDEAFARKLYGQRKAHALREKEAFMDILHSWNGEARVILKEELPVGYLVFSGRQILELELIDEKLLGPVFYAWMKEREGKEDEWNLCTEEWETERIGMLIKDCEHFSISPCEKIMVYRWERLLRACLTLKHETCPLQEQHVCIQLDSEKLVIDVAGGEVSVEQAGETEQPCVVLEGLEAIRKVFGPAMNVSKALNPLPGLFPVPFCLPRQDKF